jgi:ABC-type Fe3+/spermidine/putrescine transport system ATPase subunit
VSQDLHLFPHLSLEGNLLIAMERIDLTGQGKRMRAREIMKLLRIEHLSGRLPSMLSGGEKQRAALARALASEPDVLLLDEPFSKLDFRTARYLRYELRALFTRLGLTVLMVTHDIQEAREMGDELAVMNDGLISRADQPGTVGTQDRDTADSFLETPNVIRPTVVEFNGNGLVGITWAGLRWYVPDEGRRFDKVAVSPGSIRIGFEPPIGPSINRFTAVVSSVEYGYDSIHTILRLNGEVLRVELPAHYGRKLGLAPGDRVYGVIGLKSFEIL